MGESEQSTTEQNSNGPVSTAFALLIIAACVVGLVLLVKGLYPADLPSTTNPDFIDNVFDNRAVVWAARSYCLGRCCPRVWRCLHRHLNWHSHEEQRVAAAGGAFRDFGDRRERD